MQTGWAWEELETVKLWDPRCRRSLVRACEMLAEKAELSFSRALGGLRKAVSGILHKESVTPDALLKGHIRATRRRCEGRELVLVASDTTTLDFTTHKATTGLGGIATSPRTQGFLAHSALAMTTDGTPLGLLYQKTWVRDNTKTEQAKQRRKRTYEEKESHKWRDALRGVERALPKTVPVLLIQDREADVYPFFAGERQENVHLLLRATHPRKVQVGEEKGDLFAVVSAEPVALRWRFWLPDKSREATLELRYCAVTVLAPRGRKSAPCASVPLTVLHVEEVGAPEGVEALSWTLLTTLPVPDSASGKRLADYYSKRWLVERFHYVLKSGCQVERLQLDSYAVLSKALRLYSIVSWRLLYVTYLSRHAPDTAISEVFSGQECEVLSLGTRRSLHTVRDGVMALAQLGGFRSVPSAPEPGVKSLWLGFRKLRDMLIGFQLARSRPISP